MFIVNEVLISTSHIDLSSWQTWVSTMILMLIAYLIGSLNTGHLLSKYKNRDLGNTGSANYGATNAGRTFGKKGFIIVFLGDFLKPVILGIIFTILYTYVDFFGYSMLGIALSFVFIGHVWPVWFNFRGGKGIASFYGMVFVFNFLIAIIGGIIFLIVLKLAKRVAFASIFSIFIIVILLTLQTIIWPSDALPIVFSWSLQYDIIVAVWITFGISLYKHRKNFWDFFNEELEKRKLAKETKVDENEIQS